MRGFTLAAVVAAALIVPGALQGAAAQDGEVVVTAPNQSEADRVRNFVGAMTIPGRRAALPRWGRDICPGVAGMAGAQAQAINDRVARIALDLGLPVGASGCNANIVVVFTRNSDEVAATYTQNNGLVSTRTGGTRETVRAFAETPRAVRWWHVSTTSTDGFEVERDSGAGINTSRADNPAETDESAGGGDGATARTPGPQASDEVANGTRVRGASRLRANVELNLARVLIIVDADRVNGVRLGALADYIAMVSLAQINPDVDVTAAPSILNLFSQASGPKPDRITQWDVAYLAGLYRSPADARDARQQEGYIFQTMMESDR